MTEPVTLGKLATWRTLDANEAVAGVAYRLSEVIAIYPITPASPTAPAPPTLSPAPPCPCATPTATSSPPSAARGKMRRRVSEGETQGALPLDPTRGFASGLHKGLRPLTLSRDSVGRIFMLCPRADVGRPKAASYTHLTLPTICSV